MIVDSKKEYVPLKVLDIKEQQGQKLILVQWLNTPIEQATWQTQQKLQSSYLQIHHLIQQYHKTRAMDKKLNFIVKNAEKTQIGQNPYYETTRHGHFLYGDKIDQVESVKVYKNAPGQQQLVTVIFQIKWKPRVEVDEQDNNRQTMVILENSFIDSKTVAEYEPDFLAKFYESRILLNCVPQNSQNDIQ